MSIGTVLPSRRSTKSTDPCTRSDGRDRAVMQPGLANRLTDDDPIAGPIRCRPVERLEGDFGTVQAPELVLRFPGQDVQLDALGVGERFDAALDSVAIDAALRSIAFHSATIPARASACVACW